MLLFIAGSITSCSVKMNAAENKGRVELGISCELHFAEFCLLLQAIIVTGKKWPVMLVQLSVIPQFNKRTNWWLCASCDMFHISSDHCVVDWLHILRRGLSCYCPKISNFIVVDLHLHCVHHQGELVLRDFVSSRKLKGRKMEISSLFAFNCRNW